MAVQDITGLMKPFTALLAFISHTAYDGDPVQNGFILQAAQQRIV